MQHPQHRGLPVQANFTGRFSPREVQKDMMSFIEEHGCSTIEGPTGSGKTAVEEAVLKAADSQGISPCYLIAPNKTIVQHLQNEIPNAKVALGRHDYECLHPAYEHKNPLPMADEIPCLSLDCPHRVNQETGQTQ